MAQTKTDLQDVLDGVEDLLQNVYQPETSREEAMAAIGDALDQIAGENGDEDDDLDDSD